jgi:hypothetical protein
VNGKTNKAKSGEWIKEIPAAFVLPDTIEEIETGRATQGKLFPQVSELEAIRLKVKGNR